MKNNYKPGDSVSSGSNNGTVTKVTDEAVHVKWSDGYFQKFHFNPYHHKQTHINLLNPTPHDTPGN